MNNSQVIPKREILFYSLTGFGQNMICTLAGTFLLMFYTDAVMMSPALIGTMLLLGRLFDAFNDPIMGTLVDKTRSRWGKLRPYLLFASIPIGLSIVLCFWMPQGLSADLKLLYAYITYFSFGIIYTIIDVPYWGLSSAMSKDSGERTKLLTFARVFCTAGAGLMGLIVPLITGFFTKDIYASWEAINAPLIEIAKANFTGDELVGKIAEIESGMVLEVAAMLRKVYFFVALGTTAVAVPLMVSGFFAKERCRIDPEVPSLIQNLKLLKQNKPLLIIILAGILGALRGVYGSFGLYICKYNLANYQFLGLKGEGLFTIMGLLMAPTGLIASVLTPYFVKKMGKKSLTIWSNIFQLVLLMGIYLLGVKMFSNGNINNTLMIIIVILYILIGLPGGFMNVTNYAMIADTVDYLEMKTGKRAEGICFSMQTFINKIGMAATTLGVTLTLTALQSINPQYYIPNQINQPEITLRTFYTVAFLGAAISTLLFLIPMFFYKFTEKEQIRAVEIINNRRALEESQNNAEEQ